MFYGVVLDEKFSELRAKMRKPYAGARGPLLP